MQIQRAPDRNNIGTFVLPLCIFDIGFFEYSCEFSFHLYLSHITYNLYQISMILAIISLILHLSSDFCKYENKIGMKSRN